MTKVATGRKRSLCSYYTWQCPDCWMWFGREYTHHWCSQERQWVEAEGRMRGLEFRIAELEYDSAELLAQCKQ